MAENCHSAKLQVISTLWEKANSDRSNRFAPLHVPLERRMQMAAITAWSIGIWGSQTLWMFLWWAPHFLLNSVLIGAVLARPAVFLLCGLFSSRTKSTSFLTRAI